MEQCYSIDPADWAASHHRSLATMVQRGSHQLGADIQLGIGASLDATEGRAAEHLLP